MAVSGELRYFGPAFSSVESVRPVKAMTFPASLAMGNITRLRNLEYMLIAVLSSALPPLSFRPKGGICCSTPPLSCRASSAASFVEWRCRSRAFLFSLRPAAGRWEPALFHQNHTPPLHTSSPEPPLTRSHRLRKGNVLYFLHEAEHIARRPAPETVKELPRGMHRERRCLLAMKRTQPRKILRPRLLQLDVIAHHADDIRLLLERVREIA